MKKTLRMGFTTGSCAAAASKAAAAMLFTNTKISRISIETPSGEIFDTRIDYVNICENEFASCAVLKDGGDDPDVTTGLYIYSRVSIENREKKDIMFTTQNQKTSVIDVMSIDGERCENVMSTKEETDAATPKMTSSPADDGIDIFIDGGEGIGRVTMPGLDRSVGEAAINSSPRRMIDAAVRGEAIKAGFKGSLKVIISAPGGEETAKKTFNQRLGIKGGISILGTSGVEKPMSTQAIIDTIEVEMKVHKAAGEEYIAVTPGNYGQEYMQKTFGYDLDRSVQCSNFIGDALNLAASLEFKGLLLTGHIGKLIKLCGGITNTHSSNGDCRMELMCAAALRAGCDAGTCRRVLDCVSTEEALRLIEGAGRLKDVMNIAITSVMDTLVRKAGTGLKTECIIYSNDFGLLAMSDGAREMLNMIKGED